MILGGAKVAIASQRYQPNKDLTTAYLLTTEELPGAGWTTELQQDVPTHAGSKGDHPEIERAKLMKSTTSRRLFKDAENSKSILVEVTPLANETDAKSWVASADQRTERKMSKWSDLKEYRVIGDVSVRNVEASRGMQYSMTLDKGLRNTVAVASCADNVYVLITCSDFGQTWRLEDVIEVVQIQIDKVAVVKSIPNE